MSLAHPADFAGFGIAFDHYGSTHSAANVALCEEIWAALRKAELVAERDVTQLFDAQEGTFLADRFVKGKCPRLSGRRSSTVIHVRSAVPRVSAARAVDHPSALCRHRPERSRQAPVRR